MRVSVLFIDGCPSWRAAEAHVREALARLGRGDVALSRERVATAAQAEAVGFRGSPTILVDGRDPFPDPNASAELACRLYATPEGLARAPTVAQLVDVLARHSRALRGGLGSSAPPPGWRGGSRT